MGPGQNFDRGRVRLGQFFVAQVGSAIYGLGLENSPLKMLNFPVFSGWVKKYLGQRRVGLLFTTGQKYGRVGSGQGPSVEMSDLRLPC